MTLDGHWAAPALEQMAELCMGTLPREFQSEQELTPQARRIWEAGKHWSTLRATDGEKGGPNRQFGAGGAPLPAQAVSMWATPNAGNFNDSEQPSSFHARREALKAKGINGNGAGVPLAVQAQEVGQASRQAPTTETAGDDSSPVTPTSRLQLNARFVEVLMNLRPGWTCVCALG